MTKGSSVGTLLVLLSSAMTLTRAQTPTALLSRVDHLVYACPDLNSGVQDIERRLGVRATPGGEHPGAGTRNALVALGPSTYLEVLAPDPDQPAPAEPLTYGVDTVTSPRLAAWFVKGTRLEQLRTAAVANGVPLGEIRSGSRRTPDGALLSWRYTDPHSPVADSIVPFVIDWGTSPHPARTAAKGATLVSLRAEHPDAKRVETMLRQLGVDLPIVAGAKPALVAVIDSPRGRVELRSDR